MLRLIFMGALFAGLAWFGSTVKLGDKTLFGHLWAIGGTKESKQLVDGTKKSAKPLVDDMRRRIAGIPDPAVPPAATADAGPPQETISSADRRQLRRLIGAAEQNTATR